MNARIAKLEALLSLVQERATQPRIVTALASPAAEKLSVHGAQALEPALDSQELDEPTTFTDQGETLGQSDSLQPESGEISSGSLDQAIHDARDQPPLTPPPESGEEIARPQLPREEGPTMEQLGQTIHLEEGGPEDLELDEPDLESDFGTQSTRSLDSVALTPPGPLSSIPPSESLEANLRSPLPSQESLRVPENAREELTRLALGEPTPIEARVSKRPVLTTTTVELVDASRNFEPATFLELLDASLSLK